MSEAGVARPVPTGAILAMAGSGLALLGTFLPWASIFFMSVTGFQTGDGKVVLFLALGGGVLGGMWASKKELNGALCGLLLVLGILAAGIPFYDMINMQSAVGPAAGGDPIERGMSKALGSAVSTGAGIFVCIVGGVAMLVGSIMGLRSRE